MNKNFFSGIIPAEVFYKKVVSEQKAFCFVLYRTYTRGMNEGLVSDFYYFLNHECISEE